jgi:hypothetical protein
MTTPTYVPTSSRVLQGSASPTGANDNTTGVIVGDLWSYGTSLWYCSDATATAAVWNAISGGGGGGVTAVTGTSPIVSSGGSTPAISLATSGVTAATYGDSTHVAQFTVDNKGRITAASNVSISGGGGSANDYHPVDFNVNSNSANLTTGSGDYTLGQRFYPTTAGVVITGARIYRSTSGAGNVTVELWNASGTLIASSSSTSVSASGYHNINFTSAYTILQADIGMKFTISQYDSHSPPVTSEYSTAADPQGIAPQGYAWKAETCYSAAHAFPSTDNGAGLYHYSIEPLI